jgi:hypothetical protein
VQGMYHAWGHWELHDSKEESTLETYA